jgi:non-homologous end joining protein Ku
VKYFYTLKLRGTGSRRKTSAAKNRYYKWSWRWYLDNQCSAYKKALTGKTTARQALTAAKKAHEDASQKVRDAWNELKKSKGAAAKAAAKKKVDEAKAARDAAYKTRQAKR